MDEYAQTMDETFTYRTYRDGTVRVYYRSGGSAGKLVEGKWQGAELSPDEKLNLGRFMDSNIAETHITWKVWRGKCVCNSCSYEWKSRKSTTPSRCPNCGNRSVRPIIDAFEQPPQKASKFYLIGWFLFCIASVATLVIGLHCQSK